jgi:arsenite methyltransferase
MSTVHEHPCTFQRNGIVDLAVDLADGAPLRPGGLDLTQHLLDCAGFCAGDQVIDVGCGRGASAAVMTHRGVAALGFDVAAAALKFARAHAGQARFVAARGERLPLASGYADGVLSECSLSLMAERRAALAEWHRVLAPGGRLALTDVYARAIAADHPSSSALASWPAIARDVESAGFRIVWFEDVSELLKPWAARFIFEYGSLDAPWGQCWPSGDAMRKAKPGYFLMIADKPREGRDGGMP